MTEKFIITGIKRVILIDKNEYKDKITKFTTPLPSNELILHLSGESTVNFNGKVLKCHKNIIRFLPKGEVNKYIVDRAEHGDCIDIFFDTNIPISSSAFVIEPKNHTTITKLFKKIFSVWVAKNDGYYFECIGLLYQIFAEIKKQNYIPKNQYEAIKPAVDYINANFTIKKISIPNLAKLCNISESYLKKLFIKKYGVSPVKYIIGLKINYACDLLLSEMYTIQQISEICGYNNSHFFSRQFKEYIGISPTVFINKYKYSKQNFNFLFINHNH
ncbi:MAG: helix-turn-helix domain-containing protein [Ruminococcaceae bacterium]|nr:helix-turn-helix domain-containing protein [Oscillospiraceae bacterium]